MLRAPRVFEPKVDHHTPLPRWLNVVKLISWNAISEIQELATFKSSRFTRDSSEIRREIMSIFGSIVSAIFGSGPAQAGAAAGAAPTSASGKALAATGKPMTGEELDAWIEKLADESGQDYNWDESIVDLMKLLKLDSSLTARKQLAQELGYSGALDGSAEMNVWLHKQVMQKLAEGGGKVPDSVKKA